MYFPLIIDYTPINVFFYIPYFNKMRLRPLFISYQAYISPKAPGCCKVMPPKERYPK